MGLALVWKPRGPGSQDFLGQFKKKLGLGSSRYGIGHTGTLDPFAEGILCVGIGEGTKLLAPLMGLPKSYRARLILGASSDTLDDTGEITQFDFASISEKLSGVSDLKLEAFLQAKLGSFEQMPPQFSAIHVDGKRAYEWARLGVEKELKTRRCEILKVSHKSFRPLEWKGLPVFEWTFEVKVSSGTYIRCLARDWGVELSGAPGLLTGLIRFEVGDFSMEADAGVKWLQTPELEGLFDRKPLSMKQAENVQKRGQWEPLPAIRPSLLMNPEGEAVAWTEAGSGRLGRVFLSDPLAAETIIGPLKPESLIDSRAAFV